MAALVKRAKQNFREISIALVPKPRRALEAKVSRVDELMLMECAKHFLR